MGGVASRFVRLTSVGMVASNTAAAARTATSDHAPEQSPGFIQFARPKSSVLQRQ